MSAPETLSGNDGEMVFVRRDLADSVTAVCAYLLEHEGTNWRGAMVDEVEMLPLPEHFIERPGEWWPVVPGTIGATRYWRLQV